MSEFIDGKITCHLHNDTLRGYSAYELAVQEGFEGTLDEWLVSIKGNIDPIKIKTFLKNPIDGDAYAVDLGHNNNLYAIFSTCEGSNNTIGVDTPIVGIDWVVINSKLISMEQIDTGYRYVITNPQGVTDLPLNNGTFDLIMRGCNDDETDMYNPMFGDTDIVGNIIINNDTITIDIESDMSEYNRFDLYYNGDDTDIVNNGKSLIRCVHAEGENTIASNHCSHAEGIVQRHLESIRTLRVR